ncbi:MAG TPA: hypothetical protein VKI17_08615 [Gemmataceae bacterium]|nr:hypothetical protein [Gemmataceae bacterium]
MNSLVVLLMLEAMLGSRSFKVRGAGSHLLETAPGCAAVLARSKDPEVARRAEATAIKKAYRQ